MPPSRLPARATALLLALVAALLLFRSGAVPLLGPDEPRYARVAVEMKRAGAWVTPTLQGEAWLEKPPLYYWLAGIAYRMLGESETAARLPAALATLLAVGITALVGARLFGGGAGLHAGFVLGTSVLVFAYGRAASMDMLLAACTTAATGLIGLRFLDLAGRWAIPAASAFTGLAVLAKGPIGLLLPGLVVAAFALLTRDWRRLRECASFAAILPFLAVAAPWYVAIYREQGRLFVDVFLLNHNLQRFTSTIHRHPGPPYYYLPVLLLGLFPWTGLLLPGFGQLRPRADRRALFVLLWFAAPLVFFSAAGSKLPGYILPCLPPLAILMGRAADSVLQGAAPLPAGTGPRAVGIATLAACAIVAAAPVALAWQGEPLWRSAVPLAAWALLVGLGFGRRVGSDPPAAYRILRVGAAGVLLLIAMAAPPILARRESGRGLFIPANGREVLAWGAWRSAWMAGYFYNDARVREVTTLEEVLARAARGPVLVLCGPQEARRLERLLDYEALQLATGPRGNVLLRVGTRIVERRSIQGTAGPRS